jgi:hypothetical protein
MKWSDLCEVENLARPHWRILYNSAGGAIKELHRFNAALDDDTPEGAAEYAWECWERMSGMKRPMTPEQRLEWAQDWCERHIELEYDDVVKGLVEALGELKPTGGIMDWLKETRDCGREFSEADVNAYALWGDLADEIDELLENEGT